MLHFTKRVGHLTGIVISEQDVAVQRLYGAAVTPTPQPLTPPRLTPLSRKASPHPLHHQSDRAFSPLALRYPPQLNTTNLR